MLDINNYYIGVIRASFDYYKNPKNIRMLQGISYDPFKDIPMLEAFAFGVTTLLKKVDNLYYDEHNSRWKNELKYELHQTNTLGISLEYIKPFSECYSEKPTVYIQEELDSNQKLMEYIFQHHSYIVSHSRLYKNEVLMILQEYPMLSAFYKYLRDSIGEEKAEKIYTKKLESF